MTGAVRLKDVAAAAGVSSATVSRHLNASIVLPAATRQRIDDAVAGLGYRPNLHARSLSRGRSDQIGLVIPDLANPFFAQMAAMVEQAAEDHGLGLLLCTTSNRRDRELDYIGRLRQHQIDGLLFITNYGDDAAVAAAINRAAGIVLLDEDVATAVAPKVFADNFSGGRLAADHLIAHGHTRLAVIAGPSGLMTTHERVAGVRAAAQAASARVSVVEYAGHYARDHGRAATVRLLQEHRATTAIFTANDEILVGALEVLRDQGVRVPEQMSVVTFDDVEPLHLFAPPITAVRQNVRRMAQRAVQVLMDLSDSSDSHTRVDRVEVDLIVRASVQRARTRTVRN